MGLTWPGIDPPVLRGRPSGCGIGAPKLEFEQPVQLLEQPVQGMSVFLLTTNMRLFLNPIINHIFSPILICENPFL